jgi:hypothetical protein
MTLTSTFTPATSINDDTSLIDAIVFIAMILVLTFGSWFMISRFPVETQASQTIENAIR